MKKITSVLFAIIIMISLCACVSGEEPPAQNTDTTDYALDYSDAASFEKALNDGVKVKGKIVQFDVNEYKPDSALGINCWSGEHLNFISEEELDVKKGDLVVARITKEPAKILGSWKISYEVLSIGGAPIERQESTAEDAVVHNWVAATCLEPKTCTKCGATEGSVSTNHSWIAATCTMPKTCSLCGTTEGGVAHSWVSATCAKPKTCTKCGATEGSLSQRHSWIDATCTAPKTCSVCGKTNGDVVHNFEPKACNKPEVCSKCGAEGKIADHAWSAATCISPITCKRCRETTGDPLGHTTEKGTCTRCGTYIVNWVDGYAVVTYRDLKWLQEKDAFTDVCITGKITGISDSNDFTIIDSENKAWTVDVGTGCDFSAYVGTDCVVYGFTTGGISSQHNTPYVNMSHDDNRVKFADGRVLYPEDFESTQQFKQKIPNTSTTTGTGSVWIPTNGGTKYHSTSSCSNMKNPKQVTRAEAEQAGYTRCSRCW